MIIIHAYIQIIPEHRETFLEMVKEVISGSQAEEGNISYQLYENSQQQNAFVMVEEWKDHEATIFHRDTDHYKNFIQKIQSLLAAQVRAKRFDAAKLK